MSTHGLLKKVPDHSTYRQKDGEWVTLKCTEYLSYHNNSKHWVDGVNNRRYDSIGLDQVLHKKMAAYTKIYFHLLCCQGQRRILQSPWEEVDN